MERYIVQKYIEGKTDWAQVPEISINRYQFKPEAVVTATARLCWTDSALLVHMQAAEENILTRFSGDYDPVYRDSCLELFISPCAEDQRYFNFECNSNGATYFGFGYGRHDRMRLHPANIRSLFSIDVKRYDNIWTLDYRFPLSVFKLFFPDIQFKSGMRMRGNFYKCGNDIQPLHELMWNQIENDKSDFHQPEFFGELVLG